MAVTFVNATTNSSGSNSSSHTLDVPSGVANGDLLVALLINANPSAYTPPSGWTLLHDANTSGGQAQARVEVYWRVANNEPANYTWSPGAARRWTGAMLAFTGNDGTTPIADSDITTASGTSSVNAPSVDAVADGMLLSLVGWIGSGGSETFPVGMTQRVSQTGYALYNFGKFAYTEPTPVTGSTGVRAVSSSSSFDGAIAVNIAIQPGGAPPADAEVEPRSGIVTGSRISINVDRNMAIRSGIVAGSRIAIVAESDNNRPVAPRSGIVVGSRIAVKVDVPVAIRSGVVVGSRPGVTTQIDGAMAVRSGVFVGSRIAIKVDVPVRIRSGIVIGSRGAFQFHRNVHIRSGIIIGSRDGYTGPGTGIVVPGQRFSVNTLREGDTFRVVLPWAGLSGMTGLAHVNARTLRDDRHEQDIDLHITPLETPNIPALAGGVRPVAGADSTDVSRRLARTERETDRIERNR